MPSLSFPGRAVRRPGFLKTTFCPQAGSEKIPQTSVCPKQRWLVGGGENRGVLAVPIKTDFHNHNFPVSLVAGFLSGRSVGSSLSPHCPRSP